MDIALHDTMKLGLVCVFVLSNVPPSPTRQQNGVAEGGGGLKGVLGLRLFAPESDAIDRLGRVAGVDPEEGRVSTLLIIPDTDKLAPSGVKIGAVAASGNSMASAPVMAGKPGKPRMLKGTPRFKLGLEPGVLRVVVRIVEA